MFRVTHHALVDCALSAGVGKLGVAAPQPMVDTQAKLLERRRKRARSRSDARLVGVGFFLGPSAIG
eukprot:6957642-Alexandrium_andersonii.AAC.1